MHPLNTELLPSTPGGIAKAAQLLRDGQCVAFPTETVYGLGADATNGAAVAGIYAAKERPVFNPLIMHVATLEQAQTLAEFPPSALKLAETFWPGPLTLVLNAKSKSPVSDLACAGLATIALRCPNAPLALELLRIVDRPIAAPSANPSGSISPTTSTHVLNGLSGKIAAVLDGPASTIGLESTILDLTGDPKLLRPGGTTTELLHNLLGFSPATPAPDGTITAPGQLASHYAPDCQLVLNATEPQDKSLWLGFGPMPKGANGINLSPSADLTQAAANLFSHLRQLDDQARIKGINQIQVAPIPTTGLGLAINDRLARAAAPKS